MPAGLPVVGSRASPRAQPGVFRFSREVINNVNYDFDIVLVLLRRSVGKGGEADENEHHAGDQFAGRVRARNIRLAVVANRVRSSMPVYQPLERFLNSLSLPFLTRISDSDAYVKAAEAGIGI